MKSEWSCAALMSATDDAGGGCQGLRPPCFAGAGQGPTDPRPRRKDVKMTPLCAVSRAPSDMWVLEASAEDVLVNGSKDRSSPGGWKEEGDGGEGERREGRRRGWYERVV